MVFITEIYNKRYLSSNRKKLRNNLTPAEAGLWKYLKNKQLKGRKFRRQYSIGNYIVDFYCPEEHIAVELDGNIHQYDSVHTSDKQKEEYLESLGIKVLHFENKLVFELLETVLKRITDSFTTPVR